MEENNKKIENLETEVELDNEELDNEEEVVDENDGEEINAPAVVSMPKIDEEGTVKGKVILVNNIS